MILSEVQSLCAYDSLGRKTSRMDNDTWEYYIYDGMNLVADYDTYNGRITRTYSYGPGVDDIQSMTTYEGNEGPKTYYYIKDASNTVHVLVDETGLIVEYYYYDAFGNVKMRDEDYQWMTESKCDNRFLFQGREYDYDTALYYFRNRWYEPETGRWLSPDPIGISGGLNLYAFCGNDPVNFVDPMGCAIIVNNTGNTIIVSGNPGVLHGSGNQLYGYVPDLEIGGGPYNPIDGYSDICDAIAASKGENTKNPPVKMIHDIDFYYTSPSTSVKVWGNSLGPSFVINTNSQGETGSSPIGSKEILILTVPSALIGEVPRVPKYIRGGIEKIGNFFRNHY